jgi:hypothetical protein
MMRFFVVCFLAIGITVLLLPQQGFTAPYLNTGKIPILRVQTDQLTPLQIGLQIGHQSKALFPDIEKRYDAHLAALLTPSLYTQLQRDTLPALLKKIDPAYKKELDGVAAAWSLTRQNQLGDGLLSLNEYQLVNLLPDLGLLAGGTGFGVFSNASANNLPIVGRNLDWKSTPELRSLQTITVYQSNDKAVVNIGFAGILSILTGFNHHGLFLAHYKAEPYSPYQHAPSISAQTRSSVFDLRKVLETKQSNQEAIRYLSKQSYLYSHSILMTDQKKIQVLEYPKGGVAKIRRWNSPTQMNKPWNKQQQITVIGCHVLASLPNNCRDIKEGYHWSRLRQLAQFNTASPASWHDIADILFDTKNHLFEIFNAQTLQSIVYRPDNGSLHLYTASIDGTLSTSPIHRAYLDIIPPKLHQQASSKNKHLTVWFISAILLLLSAIVFWVTWQDKVLKKNRSL